ncbi:ribonuclease H-like domain-containing protein [Phormidium tenue]|uniref:Ribonuclease D n=1 Tax=Phormidium tenue NIES-30 TaxID=549789 RepID=A0A1U7J1E7_9CYAN|nr:ribonuclease H-like domain-containing protein [Phormidium tenue]MBD2233877.1 ribonuclease D [Phormidium tenue FACHB-1052]OKH45671.1 ribonuclease D [Phormidium tenue NIES-30]
MADGFEICDRDLTPELLARYRQASVMAIDTETMGLLPLRDRLCLVQLSDADGYVSVVRIELGQTEAPLLKELFEDSNILKLFHFARFDLATLKHNLGITVAPVFCSKIASKLSRTYSPRHGLKELVRELEGIELDKTAQSSDWGNAMHLSEEQLRYAANDVRYLHSIHQTLTAMLKREGRWELAQDCFDCLPTFVALDLLQYVGVFEH